MIAVLLLGELGKKYGRRHVFDIKTPAEAIRALCANFPGFDRHMIESGERGVGYRVLVKKDPVELEQIHHPASKQITIAPVVSGAGGKTGKILLGAALIGASFFLPAAPLIAGVASTSLASVAFSVGVSLALSGVAQMLAPQPKSDTPVEDKTEPAYLFDGPVNTTAQGHPVPIGYGRMIVGSAVISAGVDTVDVAV